MAPVPPDLRRRTASALVLAPVALAAMWLGGWPFYTLLVALSAVLTWEWLHLCRTRRLPSSDGPPATWHGRSPRHADAGWNPRLQAPRISELAARTSGLLLILSAAGAFAWLRADPVAGRADTMFLLAIVWTADIAAYVIGRTAKGPKLAPRISPNKTWSGAIGGTIAATIAGLATAATTTGTFAHAAAIAAALSIVAQAGDLAESAIKRRCGVKDSGRLIPGHGGALDRLDSTLAVGLAAALLVFLRGRGVVLWT